MRPPREDETEPTEEEESRAIDEIIARSSHLEVVEGKEGQTHVMFLGPEGLERVKKALGLSDE